MATEERERINGKDKDKFNLILDNKMKVILIKDDSSSKISVALDIHIGNFADPNHFPGLAHLCQRMIILGNDFSKGFQEILSHYGGKIFLTTSSDHSTYYFHIYTADDSVLENILERFVQIFTSIPLLENAWIEKEIRMMDLKLETELEHNWFQYFEKSMADSTHPYSNYGLCKKKILTEMSIEHIKFEILNFFMLYYSTNIMTLCIVSGYTLDKIKKMVVKIFSEIRNSKVNIPIYKDPFADKYRTTCYIAPKSDVKNLRLSFPLVNMNDNWCMAANCISFFLECNNENSLLGILKAKNWCNNISISAYQEAKKLYFFHVLITLLPKGYSHIDDIILLFFEYLKLFKINYLKSKNNRLQLNEVLSNMLKNGRFEEEQEFTQQRVIKIVQRLNEYSVQDVLSNRYFKKFNSTSVVSMINMIVANSISPSNIRIYIINKDFKDLESKWDNADYMECIVLKSVLDLWRKPLQLPSELYLPDLEFVPNSNTPFFGEKVPEVIADTLFVKLWYARAIPKSRTIQQQTKIFFHFISPHVYENPLNGILNIIFFNLIKSAIKIMNFPKDELLWQIKSTNYGLLLELTSYAPMVYCGYLSRIISKIFKLEVLPEQFEIFKHSYLEILKSFVTLKPQEQAYCYLSNLLTKKSWPYDEVLKASAYVTFDKIQEFIQKFISNIYVKCLIYGEISKAQALKIADTLDFNMKNANKIPMKMRKFLQHRKIKLENDTHILLEIENEVHNVSCTQVYYQIGKESMDLNLKFGFILYIMIQKCSEFKNKEYITKMDINQNTADGIQGLQITIEALMDPYGVQYYIHQFILNIKDYISKLPIKNFKKYQTDFIKYSKMLKLNDDISNILWVKIPPQLYCLDQQEIEEKFIQDINQESLVTFYQENICNKNATLSVHVLPKCESKLQKEVPSQLEEKEQSESRDKPKASKEPKRDTLVKTDKPGTSTGACKMSFSSRMNKTISTLSKYCKSYIRKIEDWYHSKDSHRYPETRFTRISDIMLFKQTQNYYD